MSKLMWWEPWAAALRAYLICLVHSVRPFGRPWKTGNKLSRSRNQGSSFCMTLNIVGLQLRSLLTFHHEQLGIRLPSYLSQSFSTRIKETYAMSVSTQPSDPSLTYSVASLQKLQLSRIRVVKNTRHGRDPLAFDQLVSSINRIGVLNPPHVLIESNGNYSLLVGQGRLEAMVALGWEQGDFMVHEEPLSDAQILEIQMEENEARENLNDIDRGMAWATLLKSEGLNISQLSDKIKVSRRVITRCVRLVTNAPSEILQLVRNKQLESLKAEMIMCKAEPTRWVELSEVAAGEKLSLNEIIDLLKRSKSADETEIAGKCEEVTFCEGGFIVNVKSQERGASLKSLPRSFQAVMKTVRLILSSDSPNWTRLVEFLRKKEEQERLEAEQAKMQASMKSMVNSSV